MIIYTEILKNSAKKGFIAFAILLIIYFSALTFVSGWNFTVEQFSQTWYYILSLAFGFGIQFSLYSYLKEIVKKQASMKKVMAASGTTSTVAMISCCAHYLTNVIPVLGVTGVITFVTQYQIEFFWVGLFFNFLGTLFIGSKVVKISTN